MCNCSTVVLNITSKLSSTHLVDEVGPAHSSYFANVVHETEVSFRGAIDLAHFNVPETILELPPDILSQPIPDTHPHLVDLLQLSLVEGDGCDGISGTDVTGENSFISHGHLHFTKVFHFVYLVRPLSHIHTQAPHNVKGIEA